MRRPAMMAYRALVNLRHRASPIMKGKRLQGCHTRSSGLGFAQSQGAGIALAQAGGALFGQACVCPPCVPLCSCAGAPAAQPSQGGFGTGAGGRLKSGAATTEAGWGRVGVRAGGGKALMRAQG